MGIWEDIEALPPADLDRLMRSETRLGERIRWVIIKTLSALRNGETPASPEELNAMFDRWRPDA